ncbi:hypothetical protein B0H11DRAFT_2273754 [Mycena galericulata]|nr:hypothetical protein B0H11DRAFT_2273754 [Mycena galericulata]
MIHASSPRKIEAPDTDATDVYAALEQAQRALSTAHANLKVDTIPVNVAEKRSDVLRLEISALKETFGAVVKERDAAFTEVENKERDRVALTTSVTEEREGLKREREALAKEREVQRTTFEAEKKALLDEREQIAQRLQDMSQLVRSNSLPMIPQVATPPAVDKSPTIEDCVPTAPESDAPTSGSTSPTALAAESPPLTSPKPIRHVRRTIESEISSDDDFPPSPRRRPLTKRFVAESDSDCALSALPSRKRPRSESSASVSTPPSQAAQEKSKERKTASKPSTRTSSGSRPAQRSNRPYGDSLYAIQFRPRFKEPLAVDSEVTSTT